MNQKKKEKKGNPWRFTHLGHYPNSSTWFFSLLSLNLSSSLSLSPPTRNYPPFFLFFCRSGDSSITFWLFPSSVCFCCSFCRLRSRPGCDSVRSGWMPCLYEDFLACSGRWSGSLRELTITILLYILEVLCTVNMTEHQNVDVVLCTLVPCSFKQYHSSSFQSFMT